MKASAPLIVISLTVFLLMAACAAGPSTHRSYPPIVQSNIIGPVPLARDLYAADNAIREQHDDLHNTPAANSFPASGRYYPYYHYYDDPFFFINNPCYPYVEYWPYHPYGYSHSSYYYPYDWHGHSHRHNHGRSLEDGIEQQRKAFRQSQERINDWLDDRRDAARDRIDDMRDWLHERREDRRERLNDFLRDAGRAARDFNHSLLKGHSTFDPEKSMPSFRLPQPHHRPPHIDTWNGLGGRPDLFRSWRIGR
jgi:hypothetical protein